MSSRILGFSTVLFLTCVAAPVMALATADQAPVAPTSTPPPVAAPLTVEEGAADGAVATIHDATEDAGHDAAAGAHGSPIVKQDWSFKGVFGTYDRAALQRGYQVYKQVCASCHSMDRLYFRNLADLGYTEGQIKTVAAEYSVMDGPNDEGEMFERPARPSDHFKAPFVNRQAATYANNGAYPPDLSLIAKARQGGADYIYGILTGYEEPPVGAALMEGQHWNKQMPGHIIAMAAPLADGMVGYEDGTEGTLDNYARDVSHFLTWAAEPHMEQRKRAGLKALIFLLVFTTIMYGVKKKIWKAAH